MGINMRVNGITSFKSRNEQIEKRRDEALDRQLIDMLPEFQQGKADALFIKTTVDKDDNIRMDIYVQPRKKTFFEKVRDLLNNIF